MPAWYGTLNGNVIETGWHEKWRRIRHTMQSFIKDLPGFTIDWQESVAYIANSRASESYQTANADIIRDLIISVKGFVHINTKTAYNFHGMHQSFEQDFYTVDYLQNSRNIGTHSFSPSKIFDPQETNQALPGLR